jgi:hypothetical protein
MLCIIDEFSRESLAIRVATTDVIDALCELFVLRGIPAHIRSDNSPESRNPGSRCHNPTCGRLPIDANGGIGVSTEVLLTSPRRFMLCGAINNRI